MPSVTTAVTMMNRLRRLGRHGDTSSFTDELSKVLLDLLNEAKREVLEGYQHKFDERDDIILKTFPTWTSSTGTTDDNTQAAIIYSYTGPWIGRSIPDKFYDACLYVAFTADATYGRTAFRVLNGTMVNNDLGITLERPWTGTALSSTACTLFAMEYSLPSTVRAVVSVRDQFGDLDLRQALTVREFQEIVPRPLENTGAGPEVAIVTGYRAPTYLSSNAANTGISSSNADYSLTIWPIPDDSRVINLSYIYRHPELTLPTSELVGVPSHIVDTIIMVAHAKSKITIEKEVAEGMRILERVAGTLSAKSSSEKPDPFRRRIATSLDHKSRRANGRDRLPRPMVTP